MDSNGKAQTAWGEKRSCWCSKAIRIYVIHVNISTPLVWVCNWQWFCSWCGVFCLCCQSLSLVVGRSCLHGAWVCWSMRRSSQANTSRKARQACTCCDFNHGSMLEWVIQSEVSYAINYIALLFVHLLHSSTQWLLCSRFRNRLEFEVRAQTRQFNQVVWLLPSFTLRSTCRALELNSTNNTKNSAEAFFTAVAWKARRGRYMLSQDVDSKRTTT